MSPAQPSFWFVAQIKRNGMGAARENLARQGFETFAPSRIEGIRNRRTALFPGYLFVRFDPAQAQWRVIRSTRGVIRLLTTEKLVPAPLPDGFVEALRAQCGEDGVLRPDAVLAPGDRVRILSGPFADLVGRVERLEEHGRLTLLFQLLGQSTRASIGADQLVRADIS